MSIPCYLEFSIWWSKCILLCGTNAKSILNVLRGRVFVHFGVLKLFLTDNGIEFINQVIDGCVQELEIRVQCKATTLYWAGGNFMEEASRFMKEHVIAYIRSSQRNWDHHRPRLTFCGNPPATDLMD